MKKLFVFLKPFWKAVILAPLLMVIEVVTDLMQPALLARIVDSGVMKGNLNYVIKTGLIMLLLAFIGMVGGIGCTIFASIASQNFGCSLREHLFKKIMSFSFKNIDKFKASSLITRLTNDVMQVQGLVFMSLRVVVRAPLLFIGGIVMVVLINAHLSIILLATIPIVAFSLYIISKRSMPLFSWVQKKIDRVNEVIRENLMGVRVVKAFVRETLEKSRFFIANKELLSTSLRAFSLTLLIWPSMMFAMNLSTILVLWFGAFQVKYGSMHVGEIIAYINYLNQILFSLMMIGNIFLFISRASASADRINEVLSTQVDIQNQEDAIKKPIKFGKVEFKNVTFKYEDSKSEPVLKNISFVAQPGETIAIIGATGSGKTTLVSLIPRLYDVENGSILIDDIDIKKMDIDTLRKSIGVVFQDTLLFSGTIEENIKWGKFDAQKEEIEYATQIAQAYEFINSFPDRFETIIGQRGVNLSGGQKQRLSLARAIIKNPKILILDDCTSAVDLSSERKIRNALKDTLGKCTTFIVAQRISTIMEADKIIVLDNGEIVATGTHEELIKSCSIYQEIYNSQLGNGGEENE
ncbi:ABC transporter ATP-binding protein [Caldicellulosiruptoraceae bacterium PP1]